MIIAHMNQETNQKQSLNDHLIKTASMSSELGKPFNQENVCFILGLLHDVGKADSKFQNMIINNTKDKVNHSSAGSKYIFEMSKIVKNQDNFPKNNRKYIRLFVEYMDTLMYVIQAHHGLFDILSPVTHNNNKVKNNIHRRNRYSLEDDSYNYDKEVISFIEELSNKVKEEKSKTLEEIFLLGFEEYKNILTKLDAIEKNEGNYFYRHIIVRLYLSILKNADVFDTVNAYEEVLTKRTQEDNEQIINKYVKKIEGLYKRFANPKTELNAARNKISEEVLHRAKEDSTGIYRLNLPTGAGKTNLSLRYALTQMNLKGKERYFYAAPFLSILEQNAKDIKDILEDEENIIEHHSNIVMRKESFDETNEDKISSHMKEYLIDSWDSKIVLTTMVQFFQTLFKGKSANIRRFLSLSNSVIVLDEVQSLPIETTYIFNLMLNFLFRVMNTTIILCTATQPIYDSKYIDYRLIYGGEKNENSDIIKLNIKENSAFDRVEVGLFNNGNVSEILQIGDFILKEENKSILVILNTKEAVLNLYKHIKPYRENLAYYLSTNMCPEHRNDIIKEIKERLSNKEKIICISTQLIEAGVNVDFEMLIRSYAGIDSIIQAIGRCNREGKMVSKGEVYLVNLNEIEENIKRIPSIKIKKHCTEKILDNKSGNIDIWELNDDFYERYYANNKDKMNYPLEGNKNMVDLLSLNQYEIKKGLEKQEFSTLLQSFKTSSDEFNLINEETRGIIVYYKNNIDMIEELIYLCNQYSNTFDFEILRSIKNLLRKLQPYTVNVYPNKEIDPMLIKLLNGEIQILTENYYDDKIGITEEAEKKGFII